jgi:hypothetical protein
LHPGSNAGVNVCPGAVRRVATRVAVPTLPPRAAVLGPLCVVVLAAVRSGGGWGCEGVFEGGMQGDEVVEADDA